MRALVDAIRLGAPFLGGAAVTSIPETALTAAAVEALATVRSAEARRAVRAGRAFVLQRQIADVPAALHPRCLGAFCASPIAATFRCDVSAHAALAALA